MDADSSLGDTASDLPACLRFRRNLALYASREEQALPRAEILSHLACCPSCRRELDAYRRQNRLLGEYGELLRDAEIEEKGELWSQLEGRLPGSPGSSRGRPLRGHLG